MKTNTIQDSKWKLSSNTIDKRLQKSGGWADHVQLGTSEKAECELGLKGWLRFGTGWWEQGIPEKLYPGMRAISTVTAHHNAWHRGRPQYVFLFWSEACAGLSWTLGKTEGDKVCALTESAGAVLEARAHWVRKVVVCAIQQHRGQWRS